LSLQCIATPDRVVSTDERTLFFAAAAGVFNIGWAASQNSHQSLVPELTPHEVERVLLNSCRYAAFVGSNILVLSSMFVLLQSNAFGPTPETEDSSLTYKTLTGIVLGAGVLCALAFLTLVRAPPGTTAAAAAEAEKVKAAAPAAPPAPSSPSATSALALATASSRTPLMWLQTADYYKTTLCYITMRLATNLTTLYMALFLTTTLGMEQGAIAAIPFVIFLFSLLTVGQLKSLTARLGVQRALCLGAAIFSLGSATIIVLPGFSAANYVMYAAAAALGVGLASITVSVATLQSTLLGCDTSSAGFVFGSMSALDKLVVGVVVLGVQIASDSPAVELKNFFRYILGVVPLASVAACTLLAFSIKGGREGEAASAKEGDVATPNPLAQGTAPSA
jgi:Na+/melibiose symporter-like transporter